MQVNDVQIAARIEGAVYDRILEHCERLAKTTGIKPSVASTIRMLISAGLEAVQPKPAKKARK